MHPCTMINNISATQTLIVEVQYRLFPLQFNNIKITIFMTTHPEEHPYETLSIRNIDTPKSSMTYC
jgi:hypothetical protein